MNSSPIPTPTKLLLTTLLLSIVFCISLSFFLSHPTQAQTLFETITPQNEKGFSYIQYKGEQTLKGKEILNIIEQQGCKLRVLWIPEQGIGYHTEAIGVADFVNKPFFEKALLKTDTKMTIQCIDNTRLNETIIQEPVSNITETHIHWFQYPKINTERNKQGEALIQYGGGSLYHLVGRLSTQGCNVHTLEIEDKETQRVYEYSFQNTNEQNQEFTDKYKEYIPNNTIIGISCIDNCDVIYGLDLVEDENLRRYLKNKEGCSNDFSSLGTDLSRGYGIEIDSYAECHTNWSDGALYFLSRVPVFQDICIIEVFVVREVGFHGLTLVTSYIQGKALYKDTSPFIIFKNKNPLQQRTDIEILKTELHELCHIHQDWYTFKAYIDYDYLKYSSYDDSTSFFWYETPMAQEFIDIVGFTQNEDGSWVLPDRRYEHAFVWFGDKGVGTLIHYSPIEFSAELCAHYLLGKIQPDSPYEKYTKDPYITPEIEQWIETYIVLPE